MARTARAGDWDEEKQPPVFGEARRIRREEADEDTFRSWDTPARPDAAKRFKRLEKLAWVMDRSIPVGRWRVGLDPIIGLLPGAGDFIGSVLSLYVLYEGARLGAPGSVLLRMGGNILVETVIGAVPFLGDLFDFVWQANTRNIALLHRHHAEHWRPRPLGGVIAAVALTAVIVLAAFIAVAWWVFKALIGLTPFRA
jgi:hypothetical protein